MTITELLQRAASLQGQTLIQLYQHQHLATSWNMMQNKGLAGQLIELSLGVNTSSESYLPDIPELGIEIKTVPINADGKVLESTFISKLVLPPETSYWQHALLRQKINHVLWIPLIGDRNSDYRQRTVGQVFLHQLTAEEDNILAQDWQELMEIVTAGHDELLNAHLGHWLQIRPKSTRAVNMSPRLYREHSADETIAPMAFYFRTSFTQRLIDQQIRLARSQ